MTFVVVGKVELPFEVGGVCKGLTAYIIFVRKWNLVLVPDKNALYLSSAEKPAPLEIASSQLLKVACLQFIGLADVSSQYCSQTLEVVDRIVPKRGGS